MRATVQIYDADVALKQVLLSHYGKYHYNIVINLVSMSLDTRLYCYPSK